MSRASPVGAWPRMAVARSIAEPLMATPPVGLALALLLLPPLPQPMASPIIPTIATRSTATTM